MAVKQTEQLRCHVRWCIRRDMPEVLTIENGSFSEPWSEEDFLRALRQRSVIGMVAECREKVLGYVIYELHKSKLEILNLAVHPDCRRQKIGMALVSKMIEKLSSHRRNRIVLNLRDGNLAGHLFLKAMGFEAVEVLRAYYESGEDAYRFCYRFRPGED